MFLTRLPTLKNQKKHENSLGNMIIKTKSNIFNCHVCLMTSFRKQIQIILK